MRADWEAQEQAREAFERKRTRRTWLIAFVAVPVLTLLGLVASGQLRVDRYARLGEGHTLIRKLANDQLDFQKRTGRWATKFSELEVPTPRDFTCLLSKNERLLPTSDEATPVEASELPALIDELELGLTCDDGRACDYLAACASRWQWNELMTVWFVSSRGLKDGSRKPHTPFSPGPMP